VPLGHYNVLKLKNFNDKGLLYSMISYSKNLRQVGKVLHYIEAREVSLF
jgi:hypothetical protein